MVQVRAQQPVNQDGSINLEAWLDYVQSLDPALQREGLRQACEFARDTEAAARAAQNIWKDGVSSYRTGLQIAEILADLKLDQDSLVAAIIYRAVREGKHQPGRGGETLRCGGQQADRWRAAHGGDQCQPQSAPVAGAGHPDAGR